jgi:periplasmic protein TonB
MKPAAIATTLLLHAAAVGSIVHLQSEQGTAQSKLQPFAVTLVSSPGLMTASAPAATKPDIAPSRAASDQFVASEQPSKSQALTETTGGNTASAPPQASGDTSPSSTSSSSASTTKTSVSWASYADSNQQPVYPLLSRRQEEQGTVILRILVTAHGTADRVQVRQTSGYPLLDASAVSAVQQWRFNPASVNNKPIAEWYQIAIPFTLHN